MHSVVIFAFFTRAICFIVLFYRFQVRRSSSSQYYNFSTPEWKLIKCIHETPRKVCVWVIVLRWPLRPIGILFQSLNCITVYSSRTGSCRMDQWVRVSFCCILMIKYSLYAISCFTLLKISFKCRQMLSNSEYRFLNKNEPPFFTKLAHCFYNLKTIVN